MRRLRSSLSIVSVMTIAAPALQAHAAPPEVPPTLPVPATTLHDVFRNSDMKPSSESLEALRHEGKAFDMQGPVIIAPKKADPLPMQVVGEVAVLQGDSDTVTDFGSGKYGLRYDNSRQDPMTIVDRFIRQFGDEYDFVAVWTGFWDYGADGLAYYVPIFQDAYGLGDSRYDQRQYWGSGPNGKLQGFLNMKSIDVYGNIANGANYVYPVMGQEFSHRWLAQMKFTRADGSVSDATLGRDKAHWSGLLQAEGSVQDGNNWRDNGDGTFTTLEYMVRYSPLDLYAMGLYKPGEVPDFFLIENATYRNQAVDALTQFPTGAKISGTRTNIQIGDIISANGARKPVMGDAPSDFRMAFILVTQPGQTVAQVQSQLDQIETFRTTWEAKFHEWTYGRATICTRVTAKCDFPQLKITGASARELAGDGDGMPEPGETVAISATVTNTGGGVATAPLLTLTVPDGEGLTVAAPQFTGADVAPGASITLTDAWTVTIGDDATCGQDVTAGLQASVGDYYVTGDVSFPIGYDFVFYDDFSTDRGWTVNADGTDTATAGKWERNRPTGVDAAQVGLDFQTQPESDVAGDGAAFVTGAAAGQGLGGNDVDNGTTSVTSPAISLADTRDPSLSFYTWRTGLDFNSVQGQVLPDDNDVFTTELTPDDGATWILVDSDTSNDQVWKKKQFRILDLVPTLPASIRLRFTARDADPQSLSEAAFDNVRVWDLQKSCYPDDPSDPGTTDPGTTDPGTTDPGTTDPGTTDPGTTDPGETTNPGVRGRSDSGCSGAGDNASIILLGAAFALTLARRRRVS